MSDVKGKLKPFIYPLAFVLLAVMSLAYKLFLSGTTEGFISTVLGGEVALESETAIESEVLATSSETSAASSPGVESQQIDAQDNIDATEPVLISVYICGEVNNPGVYEVPSGTILYDVADLAGGFTDKAAMTRLNLVYVIESNLSIYIPSEDESESEIAENALNSSVQSEIIRDNNGVYVWGSTGGSGGTSGSGGNGNSDGEQVTIVNINTATQTELMTLPGIGEVTSQAIITYREQTPFTKIDDIKNVTGIGDAKFNNIKDLITVS